MRLASILLVSVLVSVLPVHAQLRRGGAAAGGAKVQETTNIINDCERRTNSFKRTLDKALAHSNVRAGQAREDQLNRDADKLHDAMARTGDAWNRDHDYGRAKNNVNAAIIIARDIDKSMRNWNMGGDAESQWAAVKAELNRLALNLGLPKVW
jgi:hypothetical protein